MLTPYRVAPSRMVGVSVSVNLPLHHKVQKFFYGTGSPGDPRKRAIKRLWCGGGDGAVNIAACRLTEMAERHDAKAVLRIARGLVQRVQDLIDNK